MVLPSLFCGFCGSVVVFGVSIVAFGGSSVVTLLVVCSWRGCRRSGTGVNLCGSYGHERCGCCHGNQCSVCCGGCGHML